jgi:hypothetical protein
MSLAIIAVVTWLVMIVFAIIPKRFTLSEIVFLYIISSIMTVTVFTIIDVDLHWVPTTRSPEKSLALDICRFIAIPLLLIMSAEILNSPLKARWRWTIAAAICVFLNANDWLLQWLRIIVYRQWNFLYAFLDFSLFIVILAWIARWFVRLDGGGRSQP